MPTLVAVVPAVVGATALTLLATWVAVTRSLGWRIDGPPQLANHPLGFGDWKGVVAVAAYAPLLLWARCWRPSRSATGSGADAE